MKTCPKYRTFQCLSIPMLACLASLLVVRCVAQTVSITVQSQIDSTLGINGQFKLAMTTAFQDASWSYTFFNTSSAIKENELAALKPTSTHFQVCCDAIPLQGSTEAGSAWNFTYADTLLTPVQQTVPDHNPEWVIANAPAFMTNNTSCVGCGVIQPAYFSQFGDMSANLVRYYNTGGFNFNGTHFQSPTYPTYPIKYWGIFNEPDGNFVPAPDYANLYNVTVPKMQAVDPTIKFVALEFADTPDIYDPHTYLSTFINGVKAQVDALATHYYSSCNQRDTDQTIFNTLSSFVNDTTYIRGLLASSLALQNVPVWVTENNVNSSYNESTHGGPGFNTCHGVKIRPFVADLRATSAFFEAWRFGVFIGQGKAGAQLLTHWLYNVINDQGLQPQYSEVTSDVGTRYKSYWTDFYLSNWVPPGQYILQLTSSDTTNTDVLALKSQDGTTFTVLIGNRQVLNPSSDNNGPGVNRTFNLNLSALGTFTSATVVTLDSTTPETGPVPQTLTPSANISIPINGYGAAILKLH